MKSFPVIDQDDSSWRLRAACRGADPELFFPVGTTGPAVAQVADAKAVCHGCEVRSDCLRWALESGRESGVWGGTSERERRALAKQFARSQSLRVAAFADADQGPVGDAL
jgi:WhiB family redox-sensing transcriptional regulator